MKLSYLFAFLLTTEAAVSAFSGPFVPQRNTFSAPRSTTSLQMVDGTYTEKETVI